MHTFINLILTIYFYYFLFFIDKFYLKKLTISLQHAIRRYNKYNYNNNISLIRNCKRDKRALVVLLTASEVHNFVCNNIYYLNKKYYDRLIFFNTEKNGYGNFKNISYELISVSYLWNEYPKEFNYSIKNRIKKKRSEWGYQHMIRFFFKNIFVQKCMCDVKWFMRLDTDSIFNSSVNPFTVVNDSIVYMFNNYYPSRNYDSKYLTNGLQTFLNDYLYYYNVKPKNIQNWKTMFSSKKTKTYYNNLEIVNMNFFLSKKVQKFIDIIDWSHNIFYRSWGDAPLRYAIISIFAKKEQILSFEKKSMWFYWHDPN